MYLALAFNTPSDPYNITDAENPWISLPILLVFCLLRASKNRIAYRRNTIWILIRPCRFAGIHLDAVSLKTAPKTRLNEAPVFYHMPTQGSSIGRAAAGFMPFATVSSVSGRLSRDPGRDNGWIDGFLRRNGKPQSYMICIPRTWHLSSSFSGDERTARVPAAL